MRTICYVDGFNLYFGCLKGTPYKWLDLHALLHRIVNENNPNSEIIAIKYFTADISAKLASHGQKAQNAQQAYHRALLAVTANRTTAFEIIKGFHTISKVHMLAHQEPPDKTKRVAVWCIEEKQTDVNLALHAYRDATLDNVEQQVFVSNDSDFAPILAAINFDFKHRIRLGVVFPLPASQHERPGNALLTEQTNWTRRYIFEHELEAAQLPSLIPKRKNDIHKPSYW